MQVAAVEAVAVMLEVLVEEQVVLVGEEMVVDQMELVSPVKQILEAEAAVEAVAVRALVKLAMAALADRELLSLNIYLHHLYHMTKIRDNK